MDFVYTWYNISGKILLLANGLVATQKERIAPRSFPLQPA
jgi:hypothetical protein